MRIGRTTSMCGMALVCVFLMAGCSSQQEPEMPQQHSRSNPGPTWDGTPLEYMQAVADCLRDAGWKAEVSARPPSVESDYPASQKEAFKRDDRACMKKLGWGPVPPPITRERAEERYQHLVTMRGCLAEQGYDTSEPPSEEQFVNASLSGLAPWNPYLDVPASMKQAEWEALIAECPQTLPLGK